MAYLWHNVLTHWSRVTHICVGKLTIRGSNNGLSPGRRQAIIWTSTGILLTGLLGTNFNEIWIEIHTISFKKMHLKMSSGKWWPFVSASMCLKPWGFAFKSPQIRVSLSSPDGVNINHLWRVFVQCFVFTPTDGPSLHLHWSLHIHPFTRSQTIRK